MNTSRMANASKTTVSRSEVKILITQSTSVLIICRPDEFREGALLLRDDGRVAHQLVEPGPAVLRHDRADEAGGRAGLCVHPREIHQRRLSAPPPPPLGGV